MAEIVEEFGGKFSYVVRWKPGEAGRDGDIYFVDLTVCRVMCYEDGREGGAPEFKLKDDPGSTPNMDEAEVLLQGHIKWDGCADLQFGDDASLHLCGSRDAKMLADLLVWLWKRAAEIMRRDPADLE